MRSFELEPGTKLSVRTRVFDAVDSELWLKRKPQAKTGPNKWEVPGGSVDEPDIFSTIVRETEEETGLLIEPTGEILAVFERPITDSPAFIRYRCLYLPCKRLLEVEPLVTISEEHTDAIWVNDLEETLKLQKAEPSERLFEKVLI